MSTYCGPVRAADAAVALVAVARDVDYDVAARVSRVVPGVASTESVHAARGQMECGAHANDGFQDVRESLVLVAVMEVPAFMIMIGQPWVGGDCCHVLIEQFGAPLRHRFIDDGHPTVDHGAYTSVIGWSRLRERHLHPVLARAVDDARTVFGPVVRERGGEQDRVLAVRVEMHKDITSCWRLTSTRGIDRDGAG